MSVYSVDKDEWSPCAKLNVKRYIHASCTLRDRLYVCGGISENSIEVAMCADLISGVQGKLDTWKILNVFYRGA